MFTIFQYLELGAVVHVNLTLNFSFSWGGGIYRVHDIIFISCIHADIIISRAQNMDFTCIRLYMHDDALIGLCIFQSVVRQVYSYTL